MGHVNVESIFTYHPPLSDENVRAHEKVRASVRELALAFEDELPECPERTIAIRKLQEAMMFANSALAQNQ